MPLLKPCTLGPLVPGATASQVARIDITAISAITQFPCSDPKGMKSKEQTPMLCTSDRSASMACLNDIPGVNGIGLFMS
jgi:hypothetical protein